MFPVSIACIGTRCVLCCFIFLSFSTIFRFSVKSEIFSVFYKSLFGIGRFSNFLLICCVCYIQLMPICYGCCCFDCSVMIWAGFKVIFEIPLINALNAVFFLNSHKNKIQTKTKLPLFSSVFTLISHFQSVSVMLCCSLYTLPLFISLVCCLLFGYAMLLLMSSNNVFFLKENFVFSAFWILK